MGPQEPKVQRANQKEISLCVCQAFCHDAGGTETLQKKLLHQNYHAMSMRSHVLIDII